MKAHFIAALLTLPLPTSGAEDGQPAILHLERKATDVRLVDGKVASNFVFHLQEKTYASVEALKLGLLELPRGTIVRFRPGCTRLGGEPLDSLVGYRELGTYCEALGLKFQVLRAGGTFIYPEEIIDQDVAL